MPHATARSRGFAWGFALGAALSGAIVLIFTPRTGEEVREWIGELAHFLTERLRGALTGESSVVVAPAPSGADVLIPPA